LDGKNGWDEEKYEARLDRLCDVIVLCGKRAGEEPLSGPDVAVLESLAAEIAAALAADLGQPPESAAR
ncbi:MAG TPA: hypothetical protein PKO05_03090, partial [Thermoanaerobaculia bacterium]|nr:hypothetical protein [Thermoanaerobaculia bacterium]